MKLSNSFRALLLAGAAVLLSSPSAAHAQSTAIMKVPFAFQCGASHLEAGTYTVTKTGGIATIRGQKTTRLAMAMTFPNDSHDQKGRALFVRAGGSYYLRDLWLTGDSDHMHFVSPGKKSLARLSATVETPAGQPANVEVALLELPR